MSDSPSRKRSPRHFALTAFVALASLAIGYFAIPAAARGLVRAESVGFVRAAGSNLNYQTFTESAYFRLLRDGAPAWAKGFVDENTAAAVKRAVDRGWAERFALARSLPPTAGMIGDYWESGGILAELSLGKPEAVEIIAARLAEKPKTAATAPMTRFGSIPPAGSRIPGQFERIDAVIVSFPINYPTQWKIHARLIQAIMAEARALVLVPNEAWRAAVLAYLGKKDALGPRVEILTIPADDVWIRDYGPTSVMDPGGKLSFVWNHYSEEYTSYSRNSSDAAARLGERLSVPVYRVPLVVEGGNIISDGKGTVIMFDSVIKKNPDLDRAGVEALMRDYYGARRVLFLPSLAGELTGHIDMVVKFIDEGSLLVLRSPSAHKWHKDFEAIAETLGSTPSADGNPYRIVRVDMPAVAPDDPAFPSYVNSLVLNGSIIVPVYGKPEDSKAVEVIGRAMGGRRVVPIDYSGYPVGAIHCQTKEVFAAAPENH